MTLAEVITAAMNKRGMTLAQLKDELGTSYEYARKLSRGLAYPSRLMQREICRVLGLDAEQVRSLIEAKKLQNKYKHVPAELLGRSKRVHTLEPLIDAITAEQFEVLYDLLIAMLRRNKGALRDAVFGTPLKEPSNL